jgi:hypothetical protein
MQMTPERARSAPLAAQIRPGTSTRQRAVGQAGVDQRRVGLAAGLEVLVVGDQRVEALARQPRFQGPSVAMNCARTAFCELIQWRAASLSSFS